MITTEEKKGRFLPLAKPRALAYNRKPSENKGVYCQYA